MCWGKAICGIAVLVAVAGVLRGAEDAPAVADRAQVGLTDPAGQLTPEEQDVVRRAFSAKIVPFLERYCIGCHGHDQKEADLDLTRLKSLSTVRQDYRKWQHLVRRLTSGEMPPDQADPMPSDQERAAFVRQVELLNSIEALSFAGDPGDVLPRRLSNAEYNYTIRDLTGVDLQPAREFPVDPANQAGFDNSGESLAMSAPLLQKYLSAAQSIANHLVFKPDGLGFAPHEMVADTDRDKYCVQRIMEFYQRQPTDLADYFEAAWRYRHRGNQPQGPDTLAGLAEREGLSPRYLATVWAVLQDPAKTAGPLQQLQRQWEAIPGPESPSGEVREACEELEAMVMAERQKLKPQVAAPRVQGISSGSQAFLLWKNQLEASNRRRCATGAEAGPADADLERFCETFPDAFLVAERGMVAGRPLSAGFHLMAGYFRDDRPLCELILDDSQRRQLDQLWQELNFITNAPARQYKDYIFAERAEPPRFMQEARFDFARSEDHDVIAPEKIARLRDEYLQKVREVGGDDTAITAIDAYFTNIAAEIRAVESQRLAAESVQLGDLWKFAARAYRRPLEASELTELQGQYTSGRRELGLDHEVAVRETLVTILTSPNFLYLVEPQPEGTGVQPLSDAAIARRLSYFLWSSLPDDELWEHVAAGDLHQEDVLRAQAGRMMQDPRVRGLVTEFGANWLDFRRFEEFNAADRERFPQFTNALRQAMFEEPIQYLMDVVQNNGSVLELLDGRHTFVNSLLAEHYGMPQLAGSPDSWVRVEDADAYGRGGLLPMAVFLTQNSPGLRTSPVKRGYWVVRRICGEEIPPPPPKVPELPKDEAATGDQTLRALLESHRAEPSCAACHAKFDSLGLVFEAYGPVGERRETDLGGRPVNASANFPDGSERSGLDGLKQYLRERRRDDFLDNLARKLLAYALGRSLILTDEETVHRMRLESEESDFRFQSLIEAIVTSPQFRQQRQRSYGQHEEERQ